MLCTALETGSLNKLLMCHCRFDNDGCFERIISACTNVEVLDLNCTKPFQFEAVASLLHNPNAALKSLELGHHYTVEGMTLIAYSLVSNSSLKQLSASRPFDYEPGDPDIDVLNLFGPRLCNRSSIDAIINSNHTMETLSLYNCPIERFRKKCRKMPNFVSACLEMNKNESKYQVIHKKIVTYYFRGESDVAPFASMPISLLPKVMSTIGGGDKNRCSAVFRLLKTLPDLCNISSRIGGEH